MESYLDYPVGWDERVANEVNNGCGPDGWKGIIVPDTIYGIHIGEACKIHDFEFFVGGSRFFFNKANDRFHKNILSIIKYKTSKGKWRWTKFLNRLRRKRAKTYFNFVKEGEEYFNFTHDGLPHLDGTK